LKHFRIGILSCLGLLFFLFIHHFIKTDTFIKARNAYPMYTNFRFFTFTFGAGILFFACKFIESLKKGGHPFLLTYDCLKLYFKKLLKSPDTYISTGVFLVGLFVGEYYVLTTQETPSLFYTPTIPNISTSWGCGCLFGTTGLISYFLFRLGSGRIPSGIVSLIFTLSPCQLYILRAAPDRDYSRAPWILAIILGATYLIRSCYNFNRLSIVSSVVGIIIGLGTWTRIEVTLFIIPLILIILFFTPLTNPAIWVKRLSAVLLMVYFFFASSPRPFLDFNSQQASAGFMSSLDNSLGLSRPIYDIGYLNLDEYIDANNSFVTHTQTNSLRHKSFNRVYAETLPADFLLRILASVNKTLRLPFRYHNSPIGLNHSWLSYVYDLRQIIISLAQPLALPLAIISWIVLLALDSRFGITYLGWLFFLGTLFTTQFWQRHHFYGEIISLWNIAFLFQCIISIKNLRFVGRRLFFSSLTACACFLFLSGAITVLQMIQQTKIHKLIQEYELAEQTETDPFEIKEDSLLTAADRKVEYGQYLGTSPEIRVARFGGKNCPFSTIWPVIRYLPIETGYLRRFDWSRTIRIDLDESKSSAELYFPTWQGFQGIELPNYQTQCLQGLSRVSNPNKISVPMTLRVSSGSEPFHQILEDYKFNRVFWGTHPKNINNQQLEDSSKNLMIQSKDVLLKSPQLKVHQNEWVFIGFAAPPVDSHMLVHKDRSRSLLSSKWMADVSPSQYDTDILISKPTFHRKGELFVVQGTIQEGGLTVGILYNGQPAGNVNIVSSGLFTALFEAQLDGHYQLGLAANISGYNVPELRFEIQKTQWLNNSQHSLITKK